MQPTDTAIEVPISQQPISFHPSPNGERAGVHRLVASVARAVDDLEGQCARSDRIALQLLEALARYELAAAEELKGPVETEPYPPELDLLERVDILLADVRELICEERSEFASRALGILDMAVGRIHAAARAEGVR